MTTEKWLKEETSEQILHERTQGCQAVIVVCQRSLEQDLSPCIHLASWSAYCMQALVGLA